MVFLFNVSPATAEVPTARDIVDLGKFGTKISSISWCSDETLTFVDKQAPQGPGAETFSSDIVYMLSLVGGDPHPLVVYPAAYARADCVRGGDFVYVSGVADLAYRPGEVPRGETVVRQSFHHLVRALRDESGRRWPSTIHIRKSGGGPEGPMQTDGAGNLYSRSNGGAVELRDINPGGLKPRQTEPLSYSIEKDGFEFMVFASDQDRYGPRDPKIGIYGVSTPQIGSRSLGSYQCPTRAPRPGCAKDSKSKNVVYYTLAAHATSQLPGPDGALPGYQALYTVVPGKRPLMQYWQIVGAGPFKLPYELTVADIALDGERCLVLLEPSRGAASSRVAGRLRQDLLIADCELKNDRLEYFEPHGIGQKQGSFIFPRLSLHGETVVVTDFYDNSSQEEDQLELERVESDRARICVQLFHGLSAASLQRTNSLCASADRIGGGWDVEHLIVSPNAKFIAFAGRDDALIVGRDYRKDGRGPEWLTNGE
ncbi:hypothetical protein CWO89_41975 [Bradyrhizobium sp. Leo170]|nr:hypothetical protein CWO89_41975 [Bradyrhizobium sp. Leo170]